jgi:hypothetical protein
VGDQVEVELAAQPLLHDLQVQEAKEAAAEAEAQGGAGLHLVAEGRVVQPQPADRRPQILEIGRVHREQPAEHHRLDLPEARQGLQGGLLLIGEGVADGGVGHVLDRGGDEADLAGAEDVDLGLLGPEHADLVDLVDRLGLQGLDLLAETQGPVEHPHQHHHAEIGVVPGVHQQGLERGRGVALGRRQPGDDGLQHVGDADAGLGRDHDGVRGVQPDDVLDLLLDPVGLGGGQVDLVEDRDDLMVVVDGLVDVGEGLRLDPLGGVDHQQAALAGRQAAGDLVGEIDVAGGVDQVQHIVLAVLGPVLQADGLGLDGDAALALDVHRVEHLLLHVARGEAAGQLDQPVGQGGFAVVDVGHDGEVADLVEGGGHEGPSSSTSGRDGERPIAVVDS